MEQENRKVWNTVLGELQTEISKPTFLTFFKQTTLLSIKENVVTIGGINAMVVGELKKRFSKHIKEILDKHLKIDTELVIVPHTPQKKTDANDTPLFANMPDVKEQTMSQMSITKSPPKRVRTEFTFENMAVSSSNQLAFVSAQAVAKHPGTTYNPLFIYGPVGVGKTHLMQAIANQVATANESKKIIYITTEEFTNEVVESIQNKQTVALRRKFRGVDLFILDDVQFLSGKEGIQEELFHTFNTLIDNSAQIVLSSDRPPQEIKKLAKRLSSRFAAGLSVDIEAPDFELRTAILLIKAKKYNVSLPMESAKIIAENTLDARSLEGVLLRMITQAQTTNQEITDDFVFAQFKKEQSTKREHLHADDIITSVCNFYRIKSTLLKGPKRDASLVKARQIAMYLLYKNLGLTFVEIGNLLGGRDHTTIMHGTRKIENQATINPHIAGDIRGITKFFSEQHVD